MRLERYFGSEAQGWLELQAAYDHGSSLAINIGNALGESLDREDDAMESVYALNPDYVKMLQALVKGVEVDLDAPLKPEDE